MTSTRTVQGLVLGHSKLGEADESGDDQERSD